MTSMGGGLARGTVSSVLPHCNLKSSCNASVAPKSHSHNAVVHHGSSRAQRQVWPHVPSDGPRVEMSPWARESESAFSLYSDIATKRGLPAGRKRESSGLYPMSERSK
jgi:hypothetical protein